MVTKKCVLLLLIFVLLPAAFAVKSTYAAPGLSILAHSSYTDSIGYFHIVGEVQNTGTVPLGYVEIIATYYNQSGTVVGTDFTFSTLDTIHVAQKSPFEILMVDKTQALKVDHYTLQATYQTSGSLPLGLQILSNSSYVDSIGYMHIVGEIKNTATSKATYVQVISTCYDSTGKVVLTDFTFPQPSDIESGQKAPFEVLIIDRARVSLVTSYSLTADSSQYSLIPEFPSGLLMFIIMIPVIVGVVFIRKKLLKNQN